jgi:hypothetical protein
VIAKTRTTSPHGFAFVAKLLRADGMTEQQINLMIKENPARLLGLSVRSTAAHENKTPLPGQLFVRNNVEK